MYGVYLSFLLSFFFPSFFLFSFLSFLLSFFLLSPSHITWKLYGVHEGFSYQTTAFLLEMFLFWFRTVCELWLVSYGPKFALWSLSNALFSCIFQVQLKNYGHLKSTRPVACKSCGRTGCRCGVHVWMYQEVGVAMQRRLLYLFTLHYTTMFPDSTFWNHVRYDWWAIVPNVQCKMFGICHSVHISNMYVKIMTFCIVSGVCVVHTFAWVDWY